MELRARLIVCLVGLVLCTGGTLVFHKELFNLLRKPLNDYNIRVRREHKQASEPVETELLEVRVKLATLPKGDPARGALEVKRDRLQAERESIGEAPVVRLETQGPASGFLAVLKIGLWAGLILALPIVLSQVWAFVSPGLHANEQRAITPVFLLGTVFFVVGALIAYRFVVPMALDFLYTFNRSIQVGEINFVGPYVGFVISLMMAFGIAFEMPLVVLGLSHVGLVTPALLWRNARYAVLAAFIFGALLTPPDVISQLLLAGCLLALYLVSILFSYLVARKRAAEDVRAEDAED